MKTLDTETRTKKLLLSYLNNQHISHAVRACAVGVIKGMSSKLFKNRRRKALLFIVLQTAHIEAGEVKSTVELAKELDIRGKICNLSPRANLVQLKDTERCHKPLMKTIHISTAADLLEERARKLDGFEESHIQEMLSLMQKILIKTPSLRDHYPQKVAATFLCLYAEMNNITLPETIVDERVPKLVRILKHALSDK